MVSTWARLSHTRKRRQGLVGLLALGAILGCGKERPFARGTSPLQPNVETPADAAAEGQTLPANDDCSVLGCEAPLVCDPGSGSCVGCRAASDCTSPEAPTCDLATQTCVRCLGDADCPSQAPICKLADGDRALNRCVECTTDASCPDTRPACDPNANACTARCTTSAQCSPPTPICNEATQICVGCLTGSDCTGTADECDPATSRCVQCLDDGGCTGTQVCNVDAHVCVECLDNSQCLAPLEAHCQLDPSALETRFTCVGCIADRDCVDKPGIGGLCRPNDARCVECLSDSQCADDPAASNCSGEGVCSACAADADCSLIAGRAACLPNVGCVECVEAGDCAASPGAPVCKVSNAGQAAGDAAINTCVECTSNADCSDPGGSACLNNECQPCAANADCSHLAGSLDVCDEGTCVECTGPQRAACGANACDSQNRTCSIFAAGSAETCERCVSDSQCTSDARCVRQVVEATDLGFFCLPLAAGVPPNCGRVFVEPVALNTIENIDEQVVCSLRKTTCDGFNDFNSSASCTVDDDCGVRGIADGACNAQLGRCTIPCSGGLDCIGSCDLVQAACEL